MKISGKELPIYVCKNDLENEYSSNNDRLINEIKLLKDFPKRTYLFKDIEAFISLMKSKNIYTIARVVTFKDELQACNNFEYAIKNKNNELSRDNDKMAWIDPFDKRGHEYTIEIAEDAAAVGFDEINFDYIRFPSDGNMQDIAFPYTGATPRVENYK